jgi:hypothetical protein
MKKIVFLLAGLLSLSLNAYAARGGGSADTGGGNAVGGQLLDLFENEGTTPINVTQLKAYQQVLKPLFASIEEKIPMFEKYLLGSIQDKTWLMDPKPLSKACINESMIDVAKTPVACQTKLQVRIFEPWYKKVDLKNQAALIVHELFRNKALRLERSDEEVNYITRIVLNAESYTARELQNHIAKSGFGALGTDADILDLQVYYATFYRATCSTGKNHPLFNVLNDVANGMFDRDFYGPRLDAGMLVRDELKDLFRNRNYNVSEDERERQTFKTICSILKNSDSKIIEAMKTINLNSAY